MTQHSLTERYLYAAARELPPAQREEFRQELAERIGDAVDAARVDGASEDDAERRTLAELGEPGALAATYLDRPRYLIGPAYHSTWLRLLRLLLWIVLPIAASTVALSGALEGRPLGLLVASTFGITLTVGVHLCFWTTLVFALIERWAGGAQVDSWQPEELPEVPEPPRRRWSRAGLVVAIAWLVLLLAAIAVVGRISHPDGSGGGVPMFQTETWAWLQWVVAIVIVLHIAVLVTRYVLGGWTWLLAGVSSALATALVVSFAFVLTRGTLFNDAFLVRVGWADGPELWAPGGTLTVVVAFLFVIGGVLSVVDVFRQAWRDQRAASSVSSSAVRAQPDVENAGPASTSR